MKQEIKDIAVQAAVASPTAGWAMLTQLTVAEWVALIVGAVQVAYLLRKWWREETGAGRWMKRKAGRPVLATAPAPLGDE